MRQSESWSLRHAVKSTSCGVTTDPRRLRRCARQGRADAWQAFGQPPPAMTHPFEQDHASFLSLLLLSEAGHPSPPSDTKLVFCLLFWAEVFMHARNPEHDRCTQVLTLTQCVEAVTPKSGHGLTVDFSQALSDALQSHALSLKEEKLRYGWPEIPSWLFVTKVGTCVDPANVRRTMLRVLKAAKLPEHRPSHCLHIAMRRFSFLRESAQCM